MALNYSDSIQPRDLRDYDGPLFVKSNTYTLVSFDDNKGKERGTTMTLQPRGKDGDFQPLDRAVAENIGFQKFWRAGKVYVFKDDPSIDQQMTDQEIRFRKASEKRDKDNAVEMERPLGSDDLSSDECLECKTPIFQKQEDRNIVPPLCSDHEEQEENWVFHQSMDDSGNIKKQWKPVKFES